MNPLLVLLLLATLISPGRTEEWFDQLPSCALNCTVQIIDRGACSNTDKACLCADVPTFATGVSGCSTGICTTGEVQSAINVVLNFCGDPERDGGTKVLVVTGVFGLLSLIVVSLRMVTRIPPFKAPFGWDDGLILTVMISTIILSVGDILIVHLGFGRDIYSIPPNNITSIRKFYFAGLICYFYSIMVTKISILAFYLRIFPDRTFRISTFILMGIIIATLIAFLPSIIWECDPVSNAWTGYYGDPQHRCLNIFLISWIGSAINIVLDLAVMLLPIPHILKLSLSPRKKMQVLAMFSVGLFVTVVSAVRMHSLIRFGKTTNFTWQFVASKYMSTLEVNVGVICASMPSIQLLLRKVAPRFFGSSVDHSSYLHPYSNSHARTFRNTNTHQPQSMNITKTISTTITDMPKDKDSDSVMELVDVSKSGSIKGGSNTTLEIESARRHNW